MKKILIKIIEWYQKYISVWFQAKQIRCKFHPTCSEYTKQAIDKYGILRGSFKGLKRLLKCHPFGKGGVDHLE